MNLSNAARNDESRRQIKRDDKESDADIENKTDETKAKIKVQATFGNATRQRVPTSTGTRSKKRRKTT